MEFADWEVTLISTTLGSIVGFTTSFIIEWYKKRKAPRVMEADLATQLNLAAKDNVATTQTIIDVLETRLLKEREYFNGLVDRAKDDCTGQIEKMRMTHDEQIDELQAKIIKGTAENNELNRQVINLRRDKDILQEKVIDLQIRLQKYENNLNNNSQNGVGE